MPRIRVVDVESTGLDVNAGAKVIQLGMVDLVLVDDEWRITDPVESFWYAAMIPPEARAVHHIRPEDIAGMPVFEPEYFWASMALGEVDAWAAHNAAFEAQFVGTPARPPMLCTYKASLRLWPDAPSHSNGALRYWLENQGLIAPEHAKTLPPHRAGPDAYVTAHLLKAALRRTKASEMVRWTREPALLPTCPIGEWRGRKWADVDGGFLQWMVNKPVEPDLVWNAQRELDRRAGR